MAGSSQLHIRAYTTLFIGVTKLQPSVEYRLTHKTRKVEPELFPCLRKFGISFYEFNPRKDFSIALIDQ